MNNKIKIMLTVLCTIACDCSDTYSMQFRDAMAQHLTRKQNFANFLTQLEQYCLRMNEHNSRERCINGQYN